MDSSTMARVKIIKNDDGISLRDQFLDNDTADVTSTASDENVHWVTSGG
jgi:hypothetical protein